jgi:hypothetical protein
MGHATSIGVPIVVALIAAVGGRFYEDAKAYFLPDQFAGDWVLFGKETGDKPGEYKQFSEQLDLSSSSGVVTGTGRSGDFERNYKGFAKGDHFFVSYSTARGPGIGVLALDAEGARGKEFTGTWKGKDCTVKKIVECPAVLIKGRIGSAEVAEADKRYSTLLGGPCRDVANSECH